MADPPPNLGPDKSSPHFAWVNLDILAVLANSLALFVSFQWLTHVKCITAVMVIINDPSIDRISVVRSVYCICDSR
jgi:hypothetical protein